MDPFVRYQDDASSISAPPAVRATLRNTPFAPEANAAVAPLAGTQDNPYPVNKHRDSAGISGRKLRVIPNRDVELF